MWLLYLSEVALVVAAFVAMPFLRRASDQSWAFYQATRPIVANYVALQIVVRDRMTPVLEQVAAELIDMQPKIRALVEALGDNESGSTP